MWPSLGKGSCSCATVDRVFLFRSTFLPLGVTPVETSDRDVLPDLDRPRKRVAPVDGEVEADIGLSESRATGDIGDRTESSSEPLRPDMIEVPSLTAR